MDVDIINHREPLVLIGDITASCYKHRVIREHEAGINLLKYGMNFLGLPNYHIKQDDYGKPFFDDINAPFFSISHSSNYVACAISKDVIGIDIEKIKSVPNNLNQELNKIKYLINGEISANVKDRIMLWTVYESIAKCIGKGIPINEEDVVGHKWNISTWCIYGDYVLSVATLGN